MGVASIPLIGFSSRSVGLAPHGLSEKVRTPFVVHSQIWLLGDAGTAAIAAGCGSAGGVA
jgi:hypothetical protein